MSGVLEYGLYLLPTWAKPAFIIHVFSLAPFPLLHIEFQSILTLWVKGRLGARGSNGVEEQSNIMLLLSQPSSHPIWPSNSCTMYICRGHALSLWHSVVALPSFIDVTSMRCPPPLCLLVSTFCRAVSGVVKHGLFRLSSFPHDLVCPISKCEYLETFFLLPSCYVESKERPNNNSEGLEMKLWEVSRATPSN